MTTTMAVSPAALLLLGGVSASDSTNSTATTVIDVPTAHYRLFKTSFVGNPPRASLERCQGNCANDDQCAEGLVCYQRDRYEEVPGCSGGENDGSKTDYCIIPLTTNTPTPQPTKAIIQSPTPLLTITAPTAAPTTSKLATVNIEPLPDVEFVANPPRSPLGVCQGDCVSLQLQ